MNGKASMTFHKKPRMPSKVWVKSLSKEDKHLLLIVEDSHNMVSEQVAEQSFICGFRLAAALAMELMMDTQE